MRKVFNGKSKSELIEGTSREDVINGKGGNDELIGHRGDDVIKGGGGNDKIWGGQGEDTLWGNGGKDQFRFNSREAQDADIVKDFQVGKDKIGLDSRVFTELGGVLTEDNFVFTEALDENDHVIYDSETRQLFYDADGSGEGEKVLLATFENDPAISLASLFLYPQE